MGTQMQTQMYEIPTQPGIRRDGTEFDSVEWIDGQWCRFYRGKPRKMGGYLRLLTGLANVPRGTYTLPISPNFNVYVGDQSSLRFVIVNQGFQVIAGPTDRTPALFPAQPDYIWNFDVMYDDVSNKSSFFAFPGRNLFDINNDVETPVYYGDAEANAPLVSTGVTISGGIVSLHPYMFYYGNDGFVQWSSANNPIDIAGGGSARITDQKIVAGLPVRGGTSSPAGLFWSLDSVIRCTFTGNPLTLFNFDTVTTESSILSSNSVIEYDGTYFWAGVDRFLAYNGTVVELPNSQSLNYFFSNLNYSQRQKVWATKYTHYGEIWWFYPHGNVTECNRALVYNVRERKWYDTAINRGCGSFEQTFTKPIWCENVPNIGGTYDVWIHEVGLDQVFGGITPSLPIPFSVKSSYIAPCAIGADGRFQGIDRWEYLERIELDADQAGPMTLTVAGKTYPRAAEQSIVFNFDENTSRIDVRTQFREMTLQFSSNVLGGDFRMGRMLLAMRLGDGRQ
jgi:hypothetical protein